MAVRTVDDAPGRLDDLGLAPEDEDDGAAYVAHVQRLVVLVEHKSERATHGANLAGMVASAPARGNLGKDGLRPRASLVVRLKAVSKRVRRNAEASGGGPIQVAGSSEWACRQGAEPRWQQPPR